MAGGLIGDLFFPEIYCLMFQNKQYYVWKETTGFNNPVFQCKIQFEQCICHMLLPNVGIWNQ